MSNHPHTIRLRRPWQCHAAAAGATWTRHFQRPTGLDAQTVVSVCLSGFAQGVGVALNGQTLGRVEAQAAATRFDVTALLAGGNRLELACPGAVDPQAAAAREPPGEVGLEIRLRSALE